LTVATQDRKYLPEISIDVLICGCEVARIAAIGITAVKKDEGRVWVRFDDWLHVDGRGPCEDEVWIAKTSVELHWM
jgi:hypothetical protein